MADGSAPRSDNSPHLERINYLFAGIFNSASVTLVAFDSQTRVVVSNSAFAYKIANSSVSACLGKTVREILGGRAEDLEAAIKQVWETGQAEPGISVLTGAPGTNQAHHWLFDLIPVTAQADGLTQVVAVAVETNHQKRVEQYLLTLMADISWIRDQISRESTSLQGRLELARPNAGTSLLETVSEEVLSVSAMLQSGVNAEIDKPFGHSKTANHTVESALEVQKLSTLSPREREVLCLVAASKGNKEIATILNIETRTVETYRTRLMLKLDLHSTTEVVLYAVRNHLVSP